MIFRISIKTTDPIQSFTTKVQTFQHNSHLNDIAFARIPDNTYKCFVLELISYLLLLTGCLIRNILLVAGRVASIYASTVLSQSKMRSHGRLMCKQQQQPLSKWVV